MQTQAAFSFDGWLAYSLQFGLCSARKMLFLMEGLFEALYREQAANRKIEFVKSNSEQINLFKKYT